MNVSHFSPIRLTNRRERFGRCPPSRLACLMVLASALLACVLPQAASAEGSFALSKTERPSRVCPETALHVPECASILVPTVPADSDVAEGPPLEGEGQKDGFDPKNLREAYNLNNLPEGSGSGQTVAIVDAYNDPKAESDLQEYRKEYKVYFKGTETECTEKNGCFKKVNQEGKTEAEAKTFPKTNHTWAKEISLDLDMVSAACPECHILLVESTGNPGETEKEAIEDAKKARENMGLAEDEAVALGATEISNSWTEEEESSSSDKSEDEKYFDHEKLPITVAAGDNGYHGKERSYWPAGSKYVISVGATKLKKAKNARGWSEEVWKDASPENGGYFATTSGCSQYEEKPTWQPEQACGNKRTDNDVAADGSTESPVSVYDSYGESGWINMGGTSAATPFVAGVEAISNSAARSLGAQAFYKRPGMLFHVTEGEDVAGGQTCAERIKTEKLPEADIYLCHAETGYNAPTGWGTPDGVFNLAPTVSTASAASVTETEATLHGTVNPDGTETKYYFEYGTTTSYGKTTAEASAGSGESNVEVSKPITGLTKSMKYDYRIVATNTSKETTDGSNQTFMTHPYWAIQEFPTPAGSEDIYASGVSCASSTACIAVGKFWNISRKGYAPLADSWNGTAWSVQEVPLPTEAKEASLWGVSCTSSTACTAVGYFNNSSGVAVPLAESWSGTAWSVQEVPLPTGAKEAYLLGVSCTASTACTAVGYFDNSAGKVVPLAESWNGTSWTVQEPPSPTGAKIATLKGVSCTSSTACIATAYFENSAGKFLALAESWNGTAWTVHEPAIPTGAERSSLERVWCTSSTACIAVGYFENSSKKWVPLAESWNGTSWTVQEPPNPTGATEAVLEGVSCVSSTACTAVGHFKNSAGKEVSLAESWNGTSWTVQEPPGPAEAKSAGVKSVSCTSSAVCTAVGDSENSSGDPLPLAERYE